MPDLPTKNGPLHQVYYGFMGIAHSPVQGASPFGGCRGLCPLTLRATEHHPDTFYSPYPMGENITLPLRVHDVCSIAARLQHICSTCCKDKSGISGRLRQFLQRIESYLLYTILLCSKIRPHSLCTSSLWVCLMVCAPADAANKITISAISNGNVKQKNLFPRYVCSRCCKPAATCCNCCKRGWGSAISGAL